MRIGIFRTNLYVAHVYFYLTSFLFKEIKAHLYAKKLLFLKIGLRCSTDSFLESVM
jgi:hypothetical protein